MASNEEGGKARDVFSTANFDFGLHTLFFEHMLARIETLGRTGSPTIVAAKVKCLLEKKYSESGICTTRNEMDVRR